jgi:hypothetical protein
LRAYRTIKFTLSPKKLYSRKTKIVRVYGSATNGDQKKKEKNGELLISYAFSTADGSLTS